MEPAESSQRPAFQRRRRPPASRLDSISELRPAGFIWHQGRISRQREAVGCCWPECACFANHHELSPGQKRQSSSENLTRQSHLDTSSECTMRFNLSAIEVNAERTNPYGFDCSGVLNEPKPTSNSHLPDKAQRDDCCRRQPPNFHALSSYGGQDSNNSGGRLSAASVNIARRLSSPSSSLLVPPTPNSLGANCRPQRDGLSHLSESPGDGSPVVRQRNQNIAQPYATNAASELVHPPPPPPPPLTGDRQPLPSDHTSSSMEQINENNNNNNSQEKADPSQPPEQEKPKRRPPVGSPSRKMQAAGNDESDWHHMDWKDMVRRYGQMPRPYQSRLWWKLRQSCFCHVLANSFHFLFPVLSTFDGYSLPGDLLADLIAGFTIAVLHIPQGMAYGLLAGVEPIYGLYVSFVPVLVMALMSRSRHVSYGTFAIISMLLFNATESAKLLLKQQDPGGQRLMFEHSASPGPAPADLAGLVLTNNHQPAAELVQQQQQMLLKSLVAMRNQDELAGGQNNDTWTPGSWIPLVAGAESADFVMPSNIEILTCISILVGLIQMIMAMLRLGVLSLMFSDQLVSSFTTASAVHVVTSQLGGLFDIDMPPVPDGLFKVCRAWWATASKLFADGFNQYTALISLVSLAFLLAVKELIEPPLRRRFKSVTCLPSELILMSFMIFGSWYFQFNSAYDVRIIGNVPTGLPAPQLPRLDLTSMVLNDAITVALVSFAMNLSLAQVYAKRYRYSMDPNQELFALGASNFVGSFFSCFPCASSLSRSAVQSNLNARSQLCSLFSCAIVVAIICYFAPILHDLPRSTLSCIIIVALKGILVQIKDLRENWRLSKLDAIVWIVTFLSVMALGVTYGLVLGIVASLSMVFFRLLTPNHSILGQLPGTEIFVDRDAFIDCNEIDQIKIFRFNSALCYLNRTMFKSSVEESLPSIFKKNAFSLFCSAKQSGEAAGKVKFLIIDCSALAYCDYSGAGTLIEIIEELAELKVTVYLAACPLKLISMVERLQKTRVLERNVYPSITDAVNHAKYLRSREELPQLTSEPGPATADLGPESVVTCAPK